MAKEGEVLSFNCPELACKSVTVYCDRAEVKRLVKTSVKPGRNEVEVKELPGSIEKESIRVEGRGKATICEVQYQEKHITKGEDVQAQHKLFQEQLNKLTKEQETVESSLNRVRRQREVVDGVAGQIATGGGTGKPGKEEQRSGFSLDGENMEALEKFLGFYGKKVADLDEEIQHKSLELSDILDKIRVLHKNQRELGSSDQMSREVSIILEGAESGEVELDVSYIVRKAGWTPSYDVRVFTNDKTMKVHYYGEIKQNSGEDWTETKISLSTATPSIGGEVPELKTMKVAIVPRHVKKSKKRAHSMFMGKSRPEYLSSRVTMEYDEGSEPEYANTWDPAPELEPLAVEDTLVRDSGITTNFEIGREGTIPSDNTEHKVNVGIVELEPKLEYETVPSKSQHAYIKAKVLNKSQYAFLPGAVSVFVDNNFIAKSGMKAVSPMEEFTCSLGVDPSVRVESKPVHKYKEETGMIVRSTLTVHDHKVEIKNTKVDEDVKVRLLEHVPLSEDEKIKIALLEPVIPKHEKEAAKAPYRMNKDNNLEWDMVIQAGKTKIIQIKYSVDHPRNEDLTFREE